ncbi:MAG: hypothetical protein WBG36_14750 [Ornithinimicrobium sp.]
MNVSNVEVTAGLGGFLVVFALGLVVWFIGRDLSRRLRRMRAAEAQRLEELGKDRQRRDEDPEEPRSPRA